MSTQQTSYPGTNRFFYDASTGFVFFCQGIDHQNDILLKDVMTSNVKTVSPRAIGSTFRTVHDVAKDKIKPGADQQYKAVDTAVPSYALASVSVTAEEAAALPHTVAVFDLVGLDEYFVRQLKLHSEKALVPL